MKNFWHKYIMPNKKPILIGVFAVLTLFRVFLFLRTPLAASAETTSDDWNLLTHAWNLQNGEWLGAYQDSTLTYGIAFPFFVMLCNKLCIPFMLAAALLYIGSIVYFLHTWKMLLPSEPVRRILYLAFLYSPVMMTVYTAQRAWDFTLVPSLILLLLAFGYRVYYNRNHHLFRWILIFSAVLTFFCYLRRSNYWILPVVLGFLFFVGWQLKKEKHSRKIRVLLTPAAMLVIVGLGISLLNFHYYDKFTVYTSAENEFHDAATPSGVIKDTLYTGFHMSANQMTDVDTHPGSGSAENLRFIESITGSQVIYPNSAPLYLRGWAFPTDDGSTLELAVTNTEGQPLVFAEFENSEDVYLEHPEFSASRVSRFSLNAPVTDLRQASLSIYIDGELTGTWPLERIAEANKEYYLFLEDVKISEDPTMYTTRKAVKLSKISLFLYKVLGIPAMILAAISYIGISFSLKSGNLIFQRWIFLTGTGITALLSILLNCARYPSLVGMDPAAYSSGAWMLIQIFMALSIVWFIKPIKLDSKRK